MESRTFLVKQGHNSSFATLDLQGFSDEIPILSSTKENVVLLEQIMGYLGNVKSDVWLPVFQDVRRQRRNDPNFSLDSYMKSMLNERVEYS